MKKEWTKSKCPICGEEYDHTTDYKPATCGNHACLQEANRRGLLPK